MSKHRGPNPWGGVAEDPYSASEVVGQGDAGGAVQTLKIDHGGGNPDAVDPDETNAVRTDSEVEAGKDQQQGLDELVVEETAVARGAVNITNTSAEEASDVEVVSNVSGTDSSSSTTSSSSGDESSDSEDSTSREQMGRRNSGVTVTGTGGMLPSLGGVSGAVLAVAAVAVAFLAGGGD